VHALTTPPRCVDSPTSTASPLPAPTPRTSWQSRYGEPMRHDTPGVWIGDASAFPTASGTNPMITVLALAHRTAEAVRAAM
jgi:hypothetical protein